MWVYITVQAIPILSAYFLCHPYIPHSKFEEFLIYLSPLFLCSVMIYSSQRVFGVVGLFACMLSELHEHAYEYSYCFSCGTKDFL